MTGDKVIKLESFDISVILLMSVFTSAVCCMLYDNDDDDHLIHQASTLSCHIVDKHNLHNKINIHQKKTLTPTKKKKNQFSC